MCIYVQKKNKGIETSWEYISDTLITKITQSIKPQPFILKVLTD